MDISETQNEFLLKADLPGMKREDVKVTLENNVLTVEGERRHESESTDERTHRIERFYGGFCRRFTLPEKTDPDAIRAESRDGILVVHIPKRATPARKGQADRNPVMIARLAGGPAAAPSACQPLDQK